MFYSDLVILIQSHYLCSCLRRNIYVSPFTVETHCFADGRCLCKQPRSVTYHWNQYEEEISRKCRSVRPSDCNASKKAFFPFIIYSKIIIRISDERAWYPLLENEVVFSKKYLLILDRIFEKFYTLLTVEYSSIIDSRIIICISDERAWQPLEENKAVFWKKFLNQIFEKLHICIKNYVLAYYFCVNGGTIIFCISGEKDCCPILENFHFVK